MPRYHLRGFQSLINLTPFELNDIPLHLGTRKKNSANKTSIVARQAAFSHLSLRVHLITPCLLVYYICTYTRLLYVYHGAAPTGLVNNPRAVAVICHGVRVINCHSQESLGAQSHCQGRMYRLETSRVTENINNTKQ